MPFFPSSGPDVSVIVCTWNRAALLPAVLSSLFEQDFPEERFEIVVVDNGSSDDTASVLRTLGAGRRFRVLSEPRLGVAFARETGWRAAKGDTIVFIDDDCAAPPSWLRALTASLAARGTDVACVGGRVAPVWSAPRPAWLSDGLMPYLGLQDLGASARAIGRSEWLCSNNLAFRRAALERAKGFRTDLGRRGRRLLDGAETELEQRLMSLGYSCWYDPAPEIRHRIGAERLRLGWFLRRSFWSGASARWAAWGSIASEVRRGGVRSALRAARGVDMAGLACTAFRVAGHLYAACRPNPYFSEPA